MSGSATLFLEMNCRNALVFKNWLFHMAPHCFMSVFGVEITKMTTLIEDQCFFWEQNFKVVNCIVRVHLMLDVSYEYYMINNFPIKSIHLYRNKNKSSHFRSIQVCRAPKDIVFIFTIRSD